jgi:hypothetical protein
MIEKEIRKALLDERRGCAVQGYKRHQLKLDGQAVRHLSKTQSLSFHATEITRNLDVLALRWEQVALRSTAQAQKNEV